jgi:hypothetical protein
MEDSSVSNTSQATKRPTSPPSKTGRQGKRTQVSKACQRCKRLQKGCSDYRPCERCTKAGLEEQCSQPIFSYRVPPIASTRPFAQSPLSPQTSTVIHPGIYERQQDLLASHVIEHCCAQFDEQLRPTIPILTPEYVADLRRLADSFELGAEAYCLMAALCAMVMLQVEDPNGFAFKRQIIRTNASFGHILFEEALRAHNHLPAKSNPTLERVLLTFFLYACHAAMSHHSQAFIFLREATTLFLLMKTKDDDRQRSQIADRLFWVLLISERSHAIRYRRPATLQITSTSPIPTSDPSLSGFWSLVALFRPLDTSFISLINEETVSFPPTPKSLEFIETSINTALDTSQNLLDTQKSNLRITQFWLRTIVWQVRLHLGHLSEQAQSSSLTYHHPVEVVRDLVLSVRDLPIECIKIHGLGLTEKLFDIACAVIDVLSRIPVLESFGQDMYMGPEDNLKFLRRLMSQLPGSAIYDKLLDENIQRALPSLFTS